MPAPICLSKPIVVRWSEMTLAGMLLAIPISMVFSADAVSARFTRTAFLKSPRVAVAILCLQHLSCFVQRELQTLFWYGTEQRTDRPAQAARQIARQAYHFAFEEHAVGRLLKAPIGIHAPQEPVILAGLVADLIHVRDAAVREPPDVGDAVEHDRDHLLLAEPKRDPVAIAVVGQNLGTLQVGG